MAPSKKGYAAAPWRFAGRALYQMHLVKAETARKLVPAELKLVEAFGYTLGGFYLAHYEDSPVGAFDELVVIAGIVWNPPTSCAWAARVLVNDMEACSHGRREVGLPSYFARFSQTVSHPVKQPSGSCQSRFRPLHRVCNSLWNMRSPKDEEQTHTMDISRDGRLWCHMSLPYSLMEEANKKGPPLNFYLPSFSGQTEQRPDLLKYSCELSCRVAVCKPASISTSPELSNGDGLDADVFEILKSKPVFAMSFEHMKMGVEAPTVLIPKQKSGAACA